MATDKTLYGRYKNARNNAWQTLLDLNITSLPVDVISICKTLGINVVKNSVINELKSNESGVCLFENNEWYIIFDDTSSKERARFTIAHELGHILLGHPLQYGYHARKIDVSKPDVEVEADIYASRLLAPACVLWGLDLHTPEEIKAVCGISYTAAKIRAERMEILYKRSKFLTSPLERKIYSNFATYIRQNKSVQSIYISP